MKCVINLYKENEFVEIVVDLDNEIVKKMENFMEEESIDSEKLVHLLIEEFVEITC